MSKRKQHATSTSDDEDGSDASLINIDFEFFDPNPDIDYLALKRLLTQLLQADAEQFHINDLADLILSQPLVGTTIKCDGRESDPYAFLTVLNMHVHQNHPSIKALIAYLLQKSSLDHATHAVLQTLLGPTGLRSQNHVGFVFSERLVNMPVQVVPPMYRMLRDEIKWAVDENEPYKFSHFLFISRTYRLSPEEENEMHVDEPRSKRARPAVPRTPGGVYSFHPEDEFIQKVSAHSLDYAFTAVQPREKDSFGLDTAGRLMLMPATRLPEFVASLNEAFAALS